MPYAGLVRHLEHVLCAPCGNAAPGPCVWLACMPHAGTWPQVESGTDAPNTTRLPEPNIFMKVGADMCQLPAEVTCLAWMEA